MAKLVKKFEEMSKKDIQEAGGKAANLGELTHAGFNVPPGFCVTSDALPYLIEECSLQPRIDEIVAGFNYEDFGGMDEKTAEIRELISAVEIPADLHQEISAAVKILEDPEPPFVAVRSSVAVKDSAISSFPGMMDTYHYLKGEEEIIEHIRKCWASLWTTRATLTRHHKNVKHHLFNIGTGKGYTLHDLATSIKKIFPEATFEIGPGPDYKSVPGMCVIMDISRAKEELGYIPRFSLDEGVRDYVEVMNSININPNTA